MRTRHAIALVGIVALVAVGAIFAGRRFVGAPAREVASERAPGRYQCPMHPQIVSDKPGVCPICQMKLQPVDEPAAPFAAGEGVPGHAPFTLSTERQQLIGVTSEVVERRPLAAEIRAGGRVAYDPVLYQAIVEYREALRSRGAVAGSPWRQARDGADALVSAARLRLRQQGISEAQLRSLTAGGKDPVNLLLPDETVWVYAQVFEYEVALVRAGQEMAVTAPSLPGRTFRATVVAVDPIVDPTTRTARVRGLVPTPDASLRPQTFVNVTLTVPLGEQLAVPQNAVLDTGEHRIVFVTTEGGRFEPRAVELGREAGGYYEVLSGVAAGERVVTSANFLIDSESRFRAALAAFGPGTP